MSVLDGGTSSRVESVDLSIATPYGHHEEEHSFPCHMSNGPQGGNFHHSFVGFDTNQVSSNLQLSGTSSGQPSDSQSIPPTLMGVNSDSGETMSQVL